MLNLNQAKLNLDEVVFANRNQAYGAYALRKQYPHHVKKSLAVVLFILAAIPLLGYLMGKPQTPVASKITNTTDAIVNVVEIILEQPAISSSSIPASTSNSGYKIVADVIVKKAKQQVTTIIGHTTTGNNIGSITPNMVIPSIGPIKGTIPTKPIENPPVVDFADVMPVFDYGKSDLYQFLEQKMSYPEMAYKANFEGKVVVVFEVDEQGNVQNPSVLKSMGLGCDEEAIRVVKLMPKWKPALQNGKPVTVRMRLPISFTLN